jgi:hypothetical protein
MEGGPPTVGAPPERKADPRPAPSRAAAKRFRDSSLLSPSLGPMALGAENAAWRPGHWTALADVNSSHRVRSAGLPVTFHAIQRLARQAFLGRCRPNVIARVGITP